MHFQLSTSKVVNYRFFDNFLQLILKLYVYVAINHLFITVYLYYTGMIAIHQSSINAPLIQAC